jgi:hypothetical protein
MTECCANNDLVGSKTAWFVWYVPLVLFVIGAFWSAGRVWLWVPSLVVAGMACLLNATRCGRVHCYVTGPLFLLSAAVTVLTALGCVPVTYRQIAIAMFVGTLLAYVPECVRGKYVHSEGDAR